MIHLKLKTSIRWQAQNQIFFSKKKCKFIKIHFSQYSENLKLVKSIKQPNLHHFIAKTGLVSNINHQLIKLGQVNNLDLHHTYIGYIIKYVNHL